MNTQIDQIANNVYRICLYEDQAFISFNHFLILDDCPALIHMGHKKKFPLLLNEISKLVNPSDIRYLAFSHFESDESGALSEWLEVADNAEVCVGKICASSLEDIIDKPITVLKDFESINLGNDTLTLLETPHFPHNWDACLFHTQKSNILFGSDLGTQPGFKKAFSTIDPSEEILHLQEKLRYMSYGPHLTAGIDKLRKLDVNILAAMHGSVLEAELLLK